MGSWKALKTSAGSGWKEIDRAAGTGWKELLFETAIDIGGACIDRNASQSQGWTIISKDNPANANGTVTKLCVWCNTPMSGIKIASFYLINGTTYKCRAVDNVANLSAGKHENIVISLAVQTDDILGIYFTSGTIEESSTGYAGLLYKNGDYCVVNDESTYGLAADDSCSCYAEG